MTATPPVDPRDSAEDTALAAADASTTPVDTTPVAEATSAAELTASGGERPRAEESSPEPAAVAKPLAKKASAARTPARRTPAKKATATAVIPTADGASGSDSGAAGSGSAAKATPAKRASARKASATAVPAADKAAAPATPGRSAAEPTTPTPSTPTRKERGISVEGIAGSSVIGAAESTSSSHAPAPAPAPAEPTPPPAPAAPVPTPVGVAASVGPGSTIAATAHTVPSTVAAGPRPALAAATASTGSRPPTTSGAVAPRRGGGGTGHSFLRRPAAAVVVAVLAIGAVIGLGQVLTPAVSVADTSPVTEPVASTELVCPVTTATTALSSTVTAGVASLPSVTDGVATLADLTTKASASKPLAISEPGQTVSRVFDGKTSGPAQLARATGSFAAGFGADQVIRSGEGSTRGLAASPCARPLTDGWLIGGGSTVGRLTQVLLVNDDDRPAQVDLLVYGPDGPVVAPGGSGIVMPASSRRQVRLDALAPDQAVTAVHVIARSGRVGVSGLDQQAVGLVPEGMSLLSVTHAGTRIVIPDVPAPIHQARLDLLSPDADTTVSVVLLTPDGSLVPAGIDRIDLPSGHVVSVDLTPELADQPIGLVITSTSEIVAGVEVGTGDPSTLREKDATSGIPALTAPGIVVGLAGGRLKHAVMVAAPAADASVRLELYVPGASAPTWTMTLDIPSGSVRRVAVPVTTAAATSILVVTPVSGGPVYAGREVTEAGSRGPMIALAPIFPTHATTQVPQVVSVPGSSVR